MNRNGNILLKVKQTTAVMNILDFRSVYIVERLVNFRGAERYVLNVTLFIQQHLEWNEMQYTAGNEAIRIKCLNRNGRAEACNPKKLATEEKAK